MKEVMLILFIFLLVTGVVCAEDEWEDINDGDEVLSGQEDVRDSGADMIQLSADGEKWTSDFYIALGVGVVGLLIVILFIYLFLRGPKNKWKN